MQSLPPAHLPDNRPDTPPDVKLLTPLPQKKMIAFNFFLHVRRTTVAVEADAFDS